MVRLLALHGWGQDAELFGRKRTKDLQRKLKAHLSLHCANAPFQVGASPGERGWWTYRPEEWDGSLSNPLALLSRESFRPLGLETSLEQLSSAWAEGDFDGILGFSQGSEPTSCLPPGTLPA